MPSLAISGAWLGIFEPNEMKRTTSNEDTFNKDEAEFNKKIDDYGENSFGCVVGNRLSQALYFIKVRNCLCIRFHNLF